MATLRELKARIGSVASSEKITGAMKMISSAKMHKAERALRQLQPFRKQISTIFSNILSSDAQFSSPLIETREVNSVAIIAFGSDDGLCGAYNVNIFKQLQRIVNDFSFQFPEAEITVFTIGEKLYKASAKLRGATRENVENVTSKSTGASVDSFSMQIQDLFLNKSFDRIDMVYMGFKSVSRQRLEQSTLLPVSVESIANETENVSTFKPYLFEPDASSIFQTALPLYIMSVVQDVFVENQASEQAARIMAMQSANDNAKKLLEQLRLEYNKLRQQSITTELLDILGGQVK